MTWFLYCNSPLISFDVHGDVRYLVPATKHRCTETSFSSAQIDYDEVAKLNRASVSVCLCAHRSSWSDPPEGLRLINRQLHGQILGNPDQTKVVISYSDGLKPQDVGLMSFDIFLPRQQFEAIGHQVERLLSSTSPIQMLISVGFIGFAAEPTEFIDDGGLVPTRSQFYAPILSSQHKPYISTQASFTFARDLLS